MKIIGTPEQIELQKKKNEELYQRAHIGCSRCPHCKSGEYYKWAMSAFSLVGLFTGTDYLKDVYECKQCKGTWESGKYPRT